MKYPILTPFEFCAGHLIRSPTHLHVSPNIALDSFYVLKDAFCTSVLLKNSKGRRWCKLINCTEFFALFHRNEVGICNNNCNLVLIAGFGCLDLGLIFLCPDSPHELILNTIVFLCPLYKEVGMPQATLLSIP